MGALTPEDVRTALEAGGEVVAWTHELVDSLEQPRAALARRSACTSSTTPGMGRLGTTDADLVRELCEKVEADDRLELAGLMTHFATADEPGDDHFPAQLAAFTPLARELKEAYPHLKVHAANSAGDLPRPRPRTSTWSAAGSRSTAWTRSAHDPAERGLEPALALESYVGAVKRFEPGQSAGYGRRWAADEPTHVGTVPIGYGDGWRRALTNNAEVLVGGPPLPAGRARCRWTTSRSTWARRPTSSPASRSC